MNNLNELSKQIYKENKLRGFDVAKDNTGQVLMLVVSELAEALEADRKNRYAGLVQFKQDMLEMNEFDDENTFRKLAFEHNIKDTFQDEIADAFIRLFDLCGGYDIDIEKHIELKRKYNSTREFKHGKKY